MGCCRGIRIHPAAVSNREPLALSETHKHSGCGEAHDTGMFTQNIHANTRSLQQLACHSECYNRADRTKIWLITKDPVRVRAKTAMDAHVCCELKSYIPSLIALPVWSRQVRFN